MIFRRDFCKTTSLAMAGLTLGGTPMSALAAPCEAFPNVPGLTQYVADFIVNAKYENIPGEVLALGK